MGLQNRVYPIQIKFKETVKTTYVKRTKYHDVLYYRISVEHLLSPDSQTIQCEYSRGCLPLRTSSVAFSK